MKAILLKDDDAEISKIIDEIIEQKKQLQQRMGFIEKQADQAMKSYQKEQNHQWGSIETRLKAIGKLPSEFKSDVLSFDHKLGVLAWYKKEAVPTGSNDAGVALQDLIKGIFNLD